MIVEDRKNSGANASRRALGADVARVKRLPAHVLSDDRHRARGLIDLFAGCGGASAGFLASGHFAHLYAADIDEWAVATYGRNLGHSPELADLGALAASKQLKSWARRVRPDRDLPTVLVGCAPCQGFSSHVKMKGDRHARNPLLEALGPLTAALEPDAVFIENVPDLFAERNWDSYVRLRSELEEAGYKVRARVVNFAEVGVPQERFRAVVLARRDGEPTFPARRLEPSSFSTVREWIGDLRTVANGSVDPSDPMHQASRHRSATLQIIERVPLDGGNRPVGVGPRCLDDARGSFGGYTDVYGRLWWDRPAPTITARCRTPSCGRFAHPSQHRGLTAREAALLQTFPESWHFEGPFDDRYKQIGNAVPPLAAEAFAVHIANGWPETMDELGLLEIEDAPIGASFSVLIPGIRRRRVQVAA
jgi:DNA (cytosine-5)-methyltransferase 1